LIEASSLYIANRSIERGNNAYQTNLIFEIAECDLRQIFCKNLKCRSLVSNFNRGADQRKRLSEKCHGSLSFFNHKSPFRSDGLKPISKAEKCAICPEKAAEATGPLLGASELIVEEI